MSEDNVTLRQAQGEPSETTTPVPEATTPVPEATTPVPEPVEGRGNRKTREGLVVSDKMDKTVVVAVEDRFKHPLYGKVVRRTSKLKAHDEHNEAGRGDRVLLMETKPRSATKRWRVARILEKAK